MENKAMERKLASGEAIDLKDCKRIPFLSGGITEKDGGIFEGNTKNPLYIIERDWNLIADLDFCDSLIENWIWSIGKRKSDALIVASTTADLYQNDEYECLWLR